MLEEEVRLPVVFDGRLLDSEIQKMITRSVCFNRRDKTLISHVEDDSKVTC